jgi:hypothetical protein
MPKVGIAIPKMYHHRYIFLFFYINLPFTFPVELSTRKCQIFKNQVFAEINIHKLYIWPHKIITMIILLTKIVIHSL